MDTISIKRVTPNDIVQLQRISRQTFWETFSAMNTGENMSLYMDESFSPDKLFAEVSDKNSEFYFAMLDGDVIGYLKLNFGQSQTELKHDTTVEIERIYVLRDFHGKHIGQLLYEKAMEAARRIHAEFIWLGVWEHNQRARKFYAKNGFVEFSRHIFKLGNDEQTDIMMKLHVSDNSQ